MESIPLIYLGLPLGGYPKSSLFCQPIIDKSKESWKNGEGSVLSSLERLVRKFFWKGNKGGKLDHLAKWDDVTKSQKDEGLGLGKLKHKNLALLSKWGWRFLVEQNSLCVKWLEASMEAAPLIGIQVEKKLSALEALD